MSLNKNSSPHDTPTQKDPSKLKFKLKKTVVVAKANENNQKPMQFYYSASAQVSVRNRIILVSIILAAIAFNATSHTPSSVAGDITMIKIFLFCNHVALFCSLFNVMILTTLVPAAKWEKAFAKIFLVSTALAVLATVGAYVGASWSVWPDSQTILLNGTLVVGLYLMLFVFSFVIGVVFRPQIGKLLRRGGNKIASNECPKTDVSNVELEKVVVTA